MKRLGSGWLFCIGVLKCSEIYKWLVISVRSWILVKKAYLRVSEN